MKTMLLIAGAASVALTATASQAATRHHVRHHHMAVASAGRYAEPKQPIAYNQLAAYLKASPRARARNDWSGGMMAATTGTNVNAAATTGGSAAGANANGGAGVGMTNQTPPVAPTPPTQAPDVSNAQQQPPLNAAPSNTVAQPPASNAPATTQSQQPQAAPQ